MRILRYFIYTIIVLYCLAGQVQAAEPGFKQGDRSPQIAEIQMKMHEMGYIVGNTDGFFSWKFAQAVKAYQRRHGLKADGVIDSVTYSRIMKKPLKLKPNVKAPTEQSKPASQAQAILATAKRHIGVPYRFGGASPKGFDCSGYLQYVFRQHGIHLPRSADSQYRAGKSVAVKHLQPGDLVFFTTYEPGPSHSGIYMGNGQFIHASSSKGVMVSKLNETYWKARYLGARRIL